MTNVTHKFLSMYLFLFITLHVSSTSCLSSGEINCVNTTSGNCHSVLVTVSCAGWKWTGLVGLVCLLPVLVAVWRPSTQENNKPTLPNQFTSNLRTTRPPTQSDSYQRLYWHNLSLLMMSTWRPSTQTINKPTLPNQFTSNLRTTWPPTQSDSYQRLYWHNLSLLMMSTLCSKHVESYK